MDFTVQQFLDMFHRYNDAVWPLQFVTYGVGLLIVGLVLAKPRFADRVTLLTLAGLWAWLGGVMMLGFQTDISVSGYPFGVLFLVGAALLALTAFRQGAGLGLGRAPRLRMTFGLSAIVYALVVYPLVGMALGHTYPEAPLFGVFPCPTAIFTLGVFLCCARPRVYSLIVPLVWCFFGTMAALDMGIGQDFGLTVTAGLTIVGLVMARAERRRTESRSRAESRSRVQSQSRAGSPSRVPSAARRGTTGLKAAS